MRTGGWVSFVARVMEILVKAGQFLLSLSFLIVLHELGHFIPARLFKTRVEKFFLFFDIKGALWQKKIGKRCTASVGSRSAATSRLLA